IPFCDMEFPRDNDGQGPPSDWTKSGNANWNRNVGFGGPTHDCTLVTDDYYATIWWGYNNVQESHASQSTSGLTPGEFYRVSFRWSNLVNMADENVSAAFSVEVRDGLNNTSGAALNSVSETIRADSHGFENRSFVFQAPASGNITITWRVRMATGGNNF